MRFHPIRWLKLQNCRHERARRNRSRRIRRAIATFERAIEELDRIRWNTAGAAAWIDLTRRLWRWRSLLGRLKAELAVETAGLRGPTPPAPPRPPAFVLRGGVLHPLGQQQEGN